MRQAESLEQACKLADQYPRIAKHLSWLDFSNNGLSGRQIAVTSNDGTVDLNLIRFGSRVTGTRIARHEWGHLFHNVLRYTDLAELKAFRQKHHLERDEDFADAFADAREGRRPVMLKWLARWQGT